MLLRNFPAGNAKPKAGRQLAHYVKALTLKREAETLGATISRLDQTTYDLDSTPGGIALDRIQVASFDRGPHPVATAVVSLGVNDALEYMQAEVASPDGGNQDLSIEKRGDTVHYRREVAGQPLIEHLGYNLKSDRIDYSVRDKNGRFSKGLLQERK